MLCVNLPFLTSFSDVAMFEDCPPKMAREFQVLSANGYASDAKMDLVKKRRMTQEG
jgi:hypothetical protein